MIEPLQQSPAKEKISSYLYGSSIYFVTVGVLYLWGYWSTFNLNILEYFSLADVVKATVFPIASAFTFVVLGAVIGELTFGQETKVQGSGSGTKIGRFFRKLAPAIFVIYAFGTAMLFLYGPTAKWLIIPFLIAPPLTIFAKKYRLLAAIIPSESAHSVVLFLLCTLPTFSYGHGRMKAQEIVEGKKFEYVVSEVAQIPVSLNIKPTERLRFLGHAGDFLFYFEPSEAQVVIEKIDDGKVLILKTYAQPSASKRAEKA